MDLEAIYEQGYQYRCAGQYPEALQKLNQVIAAQPNHRQARHQIALIKGFNGDFDASLAELLTLSNEFPADNDVRYDLALTQMMLGEDESACANFRRILQSDPAHEKANQQIIYC